MGNQAAKPNHNLPTTAFHPKGPLQLSPEVYKKSLEDWIEKSHKSKSLQSIQMTKEESEIYDFLLDHPIPTTYLPINKDLAVLSDLGGIEHKQKYSSPEEQIHCDSLYFLRFANGVKYKGSLKDGESDEVAQGKFWTPSGEEFEGGLGERAKGKYVQADGTVYQGQFYKYLKSGTGKELYPNGDWYEGSFKGGLRHGKGEYHFHKSATRYRGNFIQGKRNNIGEMVFNNNFFLIGDWKEDNLNGTVCLTNKKSKLYKCRFTEGKLTTK
jgi:hypothetical protein